MHFSQKSHLKIWACGWLSMCSWLEPVTVWPRGSVDIASDFGSEGCRIESRLRQYFCQHFIFTVTKMKAKDVTFQCNHEYMLPSVVIITFSIAFILHDEIYSFWGYF